MMDLVPQRTKSTPQLGSQLSKLSHKHEESFKAERANHALLGVRDRKDVCRLERLICFEYEEPTNFIVTREASSSSDVTVALKTPFWPLYDLAWFHSNFEEGQSGASQLSSPSTNLTRGSVARRIFKVPQCRRGTVNLQTSKPYLGFEPRPYCMAVNAANHIG
ncbi:hypothetical protein TNCV_492971 [Trichonephila clavipes]|nr:hypothetical protein TNCV_492971 [Trichonephila clavipes]